MPRKKGGRDATVYDAVAGRVEYEGFINSTHAGAGEKGQRMTVSNTRKGAPVTPEEVLFRGQNAPDRYEEVDDYAYDRFLPSGTELPDSDLLKTIHAYVSDFYSRATVDGGGDDMASMDETALLACGILLEESCKAVLGETGDMVFTEPDEDGLFKDQYGPSSNGTTRPTSRDDGPDFKKLRLEQRPQDSAPASTTASVDDSTSD